MNMLLDLLGFAVKGLILVVAIVAVAGFIISMVRRGRFEEPFIRVRPLNMRYFELSDDLRRAIMEPKPYKEFIKKKIAEHKARKEPERRIYVLDFEGDITAGATSTLRHEVSAILAVAKENDEVVVRLESAGGIVHSYGFAASQLSRLRDKKIRLTVCVDKMAASGGYMMACVADKIVAAPFAVIGSIGVVASIPNVHRLLDKHGVDYEEATAGEFKRTVSFFAKISDDGRKKFHEQIEDTHALFKEFVGTHRPDIDIAKVSTGEYWFAKRALDLKLVDHLQSSDDYLLSQVETCHLYHLHYEEPQSLRDRVVRSVAMGADALMTRWWTRANVQRFG